MDQRSKSMVEKDSGFSALMELRAALEDRDHVRAIKKWLANPKYNISACIEDNLTVICAENEKGVESFSLFILIAELLKTDKITEHAMKVIEVNILNIVNNTIKYCIETWSILNKKNLDNTLKILKQWDKKSVFKLSISRQIKELEQIIQETSNNMIISSEKKDLLFEIRCLIKIICDDLKPPGTVIASTYELVYHMMYRMELQPCNVTLFCIACIFICGKLWWDLHGNVSVRHITRSYWRCVHVIDKYKLHDLLSTEDGKIALIKRVLDCEKSIIIAWGFDFSLFNSLKLSQLVDDVMRRLKTDSVDGEKAKNYMNQCSFGFSSYCCMDDMKVVVLAILIIVTNADESMVVQWTLSLKLDKSLVVRVVEDLKEEMRVWVSSTLPMIENIKAKSYKAPATTPSAVTAISPSFSVSPAEPSQNSDFRSNASVNEPSSDIPPARAFQPSVQKNDHSELAQPLNNSQSNSGNTQIIISENPETQTNREAYDKSYPYRSDDYLSNNQRKYLSRRYSHGDSESMSYDHRKSLSSDDQQKFEQQTLNENTYLRESHRSDSNRNSYRERDTRYSYYDQTENNLQRRHISRTDSAETLPMFSNYRPSFSPSLPEEINVPPSNTSSGPSTERVMISDDNRVVNPSKDSEWRSYRQHNMHVFSGRPDENSSGTFRENPRRDRSQPRHYVSSSYEDRGRFQDHNRYSDSDEYSKHSQRYAEDNRSNQFDNYRRPVQPFENSNSRKINRQEYDHRVRDDSRYIYRQKANWNSSFRGQYHPSQSHDMIDNPFSRFKPRGDSNNTESLKNSNELAHKRKREVEYGEIVEDSYQTSPHDSSVLR